MQRGRLPASNGIQRLNLRFDGPVIAVRFLRFRFETFFFLRVLLKGLLQSEQLAA